MGKGLLDDVWEFVGIEKDFKKWFKEQLKYFWVEIEIDTVIKVLEVFERPLGGNYLLSEVFLIPPHSYLKYHFNSSSITL